MISDMMLFANPPEMGCAATDVRLLIAKLAKEMARSWKAAQASSNCNWRNANRVGGADWPGHQRCHDRADPDLRGA